MRKWTLGEKIEIAIYKYVESFDRGQPHSTSVSQLRSFLPPCQDVDIVDALRRLYRSGFIALDKYVTNVGTVRFDHFSTPTEFFYGPPHGPFRVSMTPEGRQDFEKRAIQQPLVFISCGQWHQHEKDLGQGLLNAVNSTAPLKGYFAEYQSSLNNLSAHIFEALDQCAAFVAVMHHRGDVTTPTGAVTRASVWIEQEIAIAAFLTARLGRSIEIATYIQKGVCLEGLRSQLMLNPVPFETESEVLVHFEQLLPSWRALVS
jgi:hypothetical protein